MGFVLSNWKLILIAILSALVALFYNLWQGEVHDFAKFQGETEAYGKAAAKRAAKSCFQSMATGTGATSRNVK